MFSFIILQRWWACDHSLWQASHPYSANAAPPPKKKKTGAILFSPSSLPNRVSTASSSFLNTASFWTWKENYGWPSCAPTHSFNTAVSTVQLMPPLFLKLRNWSSAWLFITFWNQDHCKPALKCLAFSARLGLRNGKGLFFKDYITTPINSVSFGQLLFSVCRCLCLLPAHLIHINETKKTSHFALTLGVKVAVLHNKTLPF